MQSEVRMGKDFSPTQTHKQPTAKRGGSAERGAQTGLLFETYVQKTFRRNRTATETRRQPQNEKETGCVDGKHRVGFLMLSETVKVDCDFVLSRPGVAEV